MSGSIAQNVGYFVGYLDQPDNPSLIGINGLGVNCRECRVYKRGESRQEINNLRDHHISAPQAIERTWLE
jgi:hypothetical protein